MRKVFSGVLLALLCVGLVAFSFRVQPAKGWTDGIVTIKSDGSIDPPYAPILRNGNTYTLTDDVINTYDGYSGIDIDKNGIVIDGAGHTLQGWWSQSTQHLPGSIGIEIPLNVTIRNIVVKGFRYGILFRASGSCVYETTITNATEGIGLGSGYGAQITQCNITRNSITACNIGISLFASSNNTIVGNNISSNNDTGLELRENSHNNTISRNSIADNHNGIWFDYSWDNRVYHNVFRNNSQNVAFISPLGIEEAWDNGYPSGGNYWSDYEGRYPNATEIDHTGLWNSPYVLDPNNRDNYPLVQPFYQPIQGPTANFTYSQATAKVDEQIVFNASSSLPGSNGTYPTPITGYTWDFGDGNVTPTTQPIIEHSYSYGGAFNVTLTVTDSQGMNSSCSETVTVMMPTALSVTTNSTSTVLGYIVNIYGNLSDAHGNGLTNELVTLHYTFPGSSTWFPISSGNTDANGQYYVQWMPQATGYFTILAEWAGNATHLASNSTVNLSVLPYQSTYAFSVESNSTVTGLTFDTNNQKLSFSVSGPNGTTGYAKVTIAKALVLNITMLQVSLDDVEYSYSAVSLDDSWLLTFTYNHSIHQVNVYLDKSIIPEFPTFPVLLLFMATVLLLTCAAARRKIPKRSALHDQGSTDYARFRLVPKEGKIRKM
jgi:parallel beta-helix repeat protein